VGLPSLQVLGLLRRGLRQVYELERPESITRWKMEMETDMCMYNSATEIFFSITQFGASVLKGIIILS